MRSLLLLAREVMNAILKEEPAELSETNAKISPALDKIVRRCLEKKPEHCFRAASDLGFALSTLTTPSGSRLETATSLPVLTESLPVGKARWFGQARLWMAVAALLMAIRRGRCGMRMRRRASWQAGRKPSIRKFMIRYSFQVIVLLVVPCLSVAAQSNNDNKLNAAETWKQGHSRHGEAYDVGPREKPWVMEGIGKVSFPITTKNPEVQQWFNQGIALLHSFWFFEAERSFRWALKLDPECAMCFWGLAQAAADERGPQFLKEAAK